jgi:predicted transcriptional regulator
MDLISKICVEECSRYIQSVIKEAEAKRTRQNVILSIQPEFADKIFNHTKKYEYRKVMFYPDAKKVYVYCTEPTSKIIGYFVIDDIIQGSPSNVWRKTSKQSGITKKYFDDYFSGYNKAYAIKIKLAKLFKKPIEPKNVINGFRAPQSFMYTDFDL